MTTYSRTGRVGSSREAAAERALPLGHARVPQLVIWLATRRCPLACPHCLSAGDGDAAAGGRELALDEVARLLDQVAALGRPEFLITGGEPLARPDLPEIIELLRERRLDWTLNSAVEPDARQRAAIERHPPGFVAVSLDGPEALHDRFRGRAGTFRGARAAIRYYAELLGADNVCAGTTVTRESCAALDETFEIVRESGAGAWGLHLLVPEGRAARARELFPTRRQLRELVEFCAARRRDFPVSLADEIGWLGEREPELRALPFACGAGRTLCAVLPDGAVAPCTTLDPAARVGNIRERSLAEIWESGFAAERVWRPEGKCRDCADAPACRGGCWLQRRHGRQCFRDVWTDVARRKVSRAAVTAGAALGLGLGAVSASAAEATPPPPVAATPRPASPSPAPPAAEAANERTRALLDGLIEQRDSIIARSSQESFRTWAEARFRDEEAYRSIAQDPAVAYFRDLVLTEKRPALAVRLAAVQTALKSDCVTLSLLSLMWRDRVEAALEGPSLAERTAEERQALREALAALAARGEARWLPETRAFLAWLPEYPPSAYGMKYQPAGAYRTKGGGGRRLGRYYGDRAEVRWHPQLMPPTDEQGSKVPQRWRVGRSRFGEPLELAAELVEGGTLVRRKGQAREALTGQFTLGPFDVFETPAEKTVRLRFLLAKGPKDEKAQELLVELPAGSELTYADILRLNGEQNREALSREAPVAQLITLLCQQRTPSEGNSPSVPSPLLLPALRAALAAPPAPAATPAATPASAVRGAADLRVLLEFVWLF